MSDQVESGSRPLQRPVPRRGQPFRQIAEEVPVALTYNGLSHAVMMATPLDLEDLALGFSLTEGIIARERQLLDIEVKRACRGMVVEMTVTHECFAALLTRRRNLVGRTGCGLCGVESLDQIRLGGTEVEVEAIISGDAVSRALAGLPALQVLRNSDHAVHAAGLASPSGEVLLLREDVGRHNALDKLVGALARAGAPVPEVVVITSRVSVEMVQKAAVLGAPVLVAISAPTTLAVATAEAAGVTLVAVARDDGFETFSHPHRIRQPGVSRDVA